MDFKSEPAGRYIRIVAIISLLLGLNDAARLLGVSQGSVSPIDTIGMTGFVYLSIFCLARLFAAVGLWIKASWGAVMLVGATSVELVMFLLGNKDVQMTTFAFGVRLVLLIAILLIFILGAKWEREGVHD
jgi:hypothetical protein